MAIPPTAGLASPVSDALETFAASLVDAMPRVISAVVFLVLAAILVWVVRTVARRAIDRLVAEDEELVVDLAVTVLSLFLWFGVALAALDILGMGQIAASLGTAAGFVALGVSYALSNMIADTVAGVYLLRDPDFEPGDRVTTESVTGTVRAIGLRKSRLETEEGDTVVLANRDVDKRWRRTDRGGSEDA